MEFLWIYVTESVKTGLIASVDYFFTRGSGRTLCENLVYIAATIGKLQDLEYLKPPFLNTCEWVIRPVFPDTVTHIYIQVQ